MNETGWKAFGFEDCIPALRTTGKCKPSGYVEYDALTGYVERTYVREWTDAQGNRWRKTITVVNLGKPDRGIVGDPDVVIADDPWEDAQPPKPVKPQRKTARLLLALCEQLQERMMSTAELAACNGVTLDRIKEIMRRHPDNFEVRGRGLHGYLYGLKGHDYAAVPTASMQRILDYLHRHGPSTVLAIVTAVGISRSTFDKAVTDNPGLVVEVGTGKLSGVGQPPRLWDIARKEAR